MASGQRCVAIGRDSRAVLVVVADEGLEISDFDQLLAISSFDVGVERSRVALEQLLDELVVLEVIGREAEDLKSLRLRHEAPLDPKTFLSDLLPTLVAKLIFCILGSLLQEILLNFGEPFLHGERTHTLTWLLTKLCLALFEKRAPVGRRLQVIGPARRGTRKRPLTKC